MNKLKEISRKRKLAHAKLLKLDSKVYRAFLAMEQATYTNGALPRKTKELIAAGISVTLDCESYIQWHIDQAAKRESLSRTRIRWLSSGMSRSSPASRNPSWSPVSRSPTPRFPNRPESRRIRRVPRLDGALWRTKPREGVQTAHRGARRRLGSLTVNLPSIYR